MLCVPATTFSGRFMILNDNLRVRESHFKIKHFLLHAAPVAQEGVFCVEVHDEVGHDFLGERRLLVLFFLLLLFACLKEFPIFMV